MKSNKMKNGPKIGYIYRDNDPRTVRNGKSRYLYVIAVTDDGERAYARAGHPETGNVVKIATRRLDNGRTNGYSFVAANLEELKTYMMKTTQTKTGEKETTAQHAEKGVGHR